jgi:hypothetical protein
MTAGAALLTRSGGAWRCWPVSCCALLSLRYFGRAREGRRAERGRTAGRGVGGAPWDEGSLWAVRPGERKVDGGWGIR